jgi:hypothetical protein
MTCKICKWANHPPCAKNIPCCDCNEECNSRQCAEVTTKVCRNCKRELPLTDFYPQVTAPDGHRNICKHCYIERKMQKRKGKDHQVKHHTVMHEVPQAAEPKPRKKRVANGKGDRSEYMRQYYQGQKERLTEKNHADYIRRKSVADPNYLPKNKSAAKTAERLCEKCKNYPCFAGIENLESDFANEGCHAFRKREEK